MRLRQMVPSYACDYIMYYVVFHLCIENLMMFITNEN